MKVLKLNIEDNEALRQAILRLAAEAGVEIRTAEVEFTPAGQVSYVASTSDKAALAAVLAAHEAELLPLHFYAAKKPVTAETLPPQALAAYRELLLQPAEIREAPVRRRRIW